MEHIDIAIIGGGPAGLMAAIAAAGQLAAAGTPWSAGQHRPSDAISRIPGTGRVVVFEKGPRPGRKLLASGSGRCNLTHEGDIGSFLGHYSGGEKPPGNPADDGSRPSGSAGRFLRTALYGFDNEALRLWLYQRGLPTEADDNGKVFPVSGRSADVLAVLLREAEAAGVEIRLSSAVGGLSRKCLPDSGGWFELAGGSGSWLARAVVLAAGGHSYPALGSSGDSWRLAAGLGHTIVDPGPALAPVHVDTFAWKVCAGISLPGSMLAIRRNGKIVAKGYGDVLFTHGGLSGPGILDSSRWMQQGDEVVLPLGPFGTVDEADAALQSSCAANPGRQVRSLLGELMPKRLAEVLMGLAECPGETRAAQLTRACRQRLATGLGGESFVVERLGSLDEAMASRGGVALDEVDGKTMMSRLIPGMFCAGEALDVDGDTGGYNLQAAFSTGRLAGLSVAGLAASALA
jgi:predicted Rossmann fold flavoprotein